MRHKNTHVPQAKQFKIKNNLYRQQLYPTHTRTYHNMLNPNQQRMYNGKFVWLNYRSI